ncbi:uncharacterized protein LOC127851174 [Dreissena polymorpha]|uniref:Uncharacterized protein n=1 Tax=Dreissena polymorpha TaxID=45954 RepID=A0A9D4D0K8_DREPO|nr:uncharacterized protein LOC127851174 [Dreissena polymorpha]KAH3735755.1 hypothetical protein DPMN_042290 [Dreissena polymorpha]
MDETTLHKKLWLRLKRKDLGDEECSEVVCIDLKDSQSGHDIKEAILRSCNLYNLQNIVLKLRNHRGSIIPITWNVSANSSARPYVLEVVKIHQNIKAQPRSVKIRSYNDTVKEKLTDITQRIEKLEGEAPALKEKRSDKIDNDMKKVEQMLVFLEKRMQDAENVSWKGMFKKNPLW